MKKRLLTSLILLALFLPVEVLSKPKPDPWLIVPGKSVGPITAKTTEADLIRIYGKKNVVYADIYRGEGQFLSGTILFPKDPIKALTIDWQDEKQRKYPSYINLGSVDANLKLNTHTSPRHIVIHNQHSIWHTKEGITLGTAIPDLERLNGKPFMVALDCFMYDGECGVDSWRGGRLSKEFTGIGVTSYTTGLAFGRKNDKPLSNREGQTIYQHKSTNYNYLSSSPFLRNLKLQVVSIGTAFKVPSQSKTKDLHRIVAGMTLQDVEKVYKRPFTVIGCHVRHLGDIEYYLLLVDRDTQNDGVYLLPSRNFETVSWTGKPISNQKLGKLFAKTGVPSVSVYTKCSAFTEHFMNTFSE